MTEEDQIQQSLLRSLQEDNAKMRQAGCKLAEAAIQVVREYDGLHRLMLAVAEWSMVIANEGGRGEHHSIPADTSDTVHPD